VPTLTPTPDPCTGWWCTVSGVVYAGTAQPGNELEGTTVTLQHTSYCSPTRGERQTETGPDGSFAFGDVFLHDTDRIRITVALEGYESAGWDSVDRYCLYCSCFGEPLEIVLRAAQGPWGSGQTPKAPAGCCFVVLTGTLVLVECSLEDRL
jgi:hypothetical protein